MSANGPFTVDDFETLSRLVLDAWSGAVDRDWSLPAGTLEWTCFTTADHTIDCVFSYAFFLASRRLDSYPPFGELHALPGATPADLLDGLRATCELLAATAAHATPETRAVIFGRRGTNGSPSDFAARGGHELILHAYDVCTGLGVAFDPPRDLCQRLWDHTRDWPIGPDLESSADPWSDLLERSGRPRVS